MRCFKRYTFPQCPDCKKPVPFFNRLRCFMVYVTWRTDPLPVEHLLGWLGLISGVIFLRDPHGSPTFVLMSRFLPSVCWGLTILLIGVGQLITPMFGTVGWVRRIRLAIAFTAGLFWTAMGTMTLVSGLLAPLGDLAVVFSAAGWWIFLRTPDCAPLRRGSGDADRH